MNEIEKRISDIDANHSEIKIIKEIELGEATLCVFECVGNDCTSSAIVYGDGKDLFVQDDWQGDYPETFEEIENFGWMHESGKIGIIFNGLPKIFA